MTSALISDPSMSNTLDTPTRPCGKLSPGLNQDGRSADSDGRSLHIAGLGQRPVPRHSTTLNGVSLSEERGAGLVRLDRVEGEDSGQTGPGDDPRFAVLGGWSRNRGPQTTVTELFCNGTFSPL